MSPEIASVGKIADIISYIDHFPQSKILVIGDAMLDEYLIGDTDRISPEAPVPVVKITSSRHLLGGAGNVAKNVRTLGGQVSLMGIIGPDPAGQSIKEQLEQLGIEAHLYVQRDRPTTIKSRILARRQQVLRFDREVTQPLTPEKEADFLSMLPNCLNGCGAIIISDYGKGLITPSLMAGLRACIARLALDIPILVDPKPQNIAAYEHVTLLTPNAKETCESAKMPIRTTQELLAAGKAIMARLSCQHLVTTLGPQGMAVFHSQDDVWKIPTVARSVFDVTGAGDTVIATMALGLASGCALDMACVLANYAAGVVVGQVGAASVTPDQLRHAFSHLPQPVLERLG